MATLNISLPNEMRQWIASQIECGEYANASDYLRDLIRQNQRGRELLRLALIEGEQSGESRRTVKEILADAKARAKRA